VIRASQVVGLKKTSKRGRLDATEWQLRSRYILKHLDDPIALHRSPVCRLSKLENMAKAKYPDGIVAHGRALHDLTVQCLQEIENELDGHNSVAKLKEFVSLTREGKGVTEASRLLGMSREHTCRSLKRDLIELLAQKLISKLRSRS